MNPSNELNYFLDLGQIIKNKYSPRANLNENVQNSSK
jgi:hypothetical protein